MDADVELDADLENLLDQVSERLREIRLKRDLSQEDFDMSEPKGVSVAAVRAMEGKRKRNIELKTLFRFCRRAGIHPKEVFNFTVPWPVKPVAKGRLDQARAPRKSRKP